MRNFRIVPLSLDYVQNIKLAGIDEFGHQVIEQVSPGYGPCRVSLKPFVPGSDRRLLFCHSPFDMDNAFNQPGPVVIFKDEVEPYSDIYRFPPEIKADKINFHLLLIGYNREQHMNFTRLVGGDDVVKYLHARNAEACCFICKIERI